MTTAPGQRVPTWLRVGLVIACAPVLIAVMVRGARAATTAAAPGTAARTRRGGSPGHDRASTAAVDATTPTGWFSPARLRGHLDGSGRSRAEVATRIGCTEAEVASYEDGAAVPPPRVLAAVLGVPVDDLHQKRHDWAADYVDTVAMYCPPDTDAELDAVAAALRRLDAIVDRHRRVAAAAAGPTPALTVVRGG